MIKNSVTVAKDHNFVVLKVRIYSILHFTDKVAITNIHLRSSKYQK